MSETLRAVIPHAGSHSVCQGRSLIGIALSDWLALGREPLLVGGVQEYVSGRFPLLEEPP